MTDTMLQRVIFVVLFSLGSLLHASAEPNGPVFLNPVAQQQVVAEAKPQTANYVTQTVYGFLDFTTTIGNTIMVFSPQSAAPEEPKIEPPKTTIIETRPPESIPKEVPSTTIKPSKTLPKPDRKEPNSPVQNKVASAIKVESSIIQMASSKVEVFSEPSSKVNLVEPKPNIVKHAPVFSSKVEVVAGTPAIQSVITKLEKKSQESPKPVLFSSRVEVFEEPSIESQQPIETLFSSVEVKSNNDNAVIVANNIGEPEFDFLSRQPSEVVEETYKVINLKPSSKFHLKPRPASGATKAAHGPGVGGSLKRGGAHPTGLVTKLGGTVVQDGATTIHETSVIGTYISGKYAQVLQSTSHIVHSNKPKINPSPSLRILKTAAPALGKGHKHHHHHLDPTPVSNLHEETAALPVEGLFNSPGNAIKSTRRSVSGGRSSDSKARFRNRNKEQEVEEPEHETNHGHSGHKKSSRIRPTQTRPFKHNKFGRSTKTIATVSVHSDAPSTVTPSAGRKYQSSRRNKPSRQTTSTVSPNESSNYNRRGYKPRVQSSASEPTPASTSLYKFKLNRAPGRWQYKTTPKPRVTIRKQNDDENTQATTPTSVQDSSPVFNNASPQARSDDLDLNPLGSEQSNANLDDDNADNKLEQQFPLETIKVDISTPSDFKNTYYEIATIKSPYTFQVGSVKNTRYITVTSTYEKTIDSPESTIMHSTTEPLTENILATSARYNKDDHLDSGIATLPPVFLASDMATPPLETLTETFSTTQDMLKTHILPVIKGGNETMTYTLVQTYHVTRLVTATKTLPPMEVYQFVPSKILKDFNSHLDEAGSELHLELEFGDDNDDNDNQPRRSFPPDLNLANIGSDFDLSDVDKKSPEGHLRLKKAPAPQPKPALPEQPATPALSPEQLQQLAILRLLNPVAAQPQIITTSKPVIKLETVYESHVIPIFNGVSTTLSTISRPIATISKTEYELGTSTLPGLPLPVPVPPVNPLFPQQQQQFALTSTPVVTQTVITETDSKVLKLTFGAKTTYTTLLSTRVVPTMITTYVTASLPVQPTAAFPGYFPGPFGAFPFVG